MCRKILKGEIFMEKNRKNNILDMTTGNPARLLLKFALPLIIGNVLQQFYNMADTAIAGHLIGDQALAQMAPHRPFMV